MAVADVGGADAGPRQRPVYSIGAVVRMVGVDASTLRAWEERYGLVLPARSRGGQRLYSRGDVENLRFVLGEMEAGSSPADAHRLLAEKLQSPAPVPPEPEGTGMVILLAEHNRYSAELTEYLLRTEGFEVCVTFDARAVGPLLAERDPDLAVVDLMLPGGGLELCAQITRSTDTPVLAVSALDLADQAVAAGASAFVAKPINLLDFVSTVRDLLGQSALTQPSRTSAS